MTVLVLLVVVVVVLLTFLAFGRGEIETRNAYLSLVSFVALAVAAVGLVIFLDGVVNVAIPGQVHNAGGGAITLPGFAGAARRAPIGGGFGMGGVVRPFGGLGNGGAMRGAPAPPTTQPPKPGSPPSTPAPNGQFRQRMRAFINQFPARSSFALGRRTGDIRSRGWVEMARGFILLLVAGAIFVYHWRFIRPGAPAPAASAAEVA